MTHVTPVDLPLTERLSAFGFDVPSQVFNLWSLEMRQLVEQTITRWEGDYQQAMSGIAIAESDRIRIPKQLAAFEAILATDACRARDHGRAAATSHRSSDCNPYPPGTALSKIWRAALSPTGNTAK